MVDSPLATHARAKPKTELDLADQVHLEVRCGCRFIFEFGRTNFSVSTASTPPGLRRRTIRMGSTIKKYCLRWSLCKPRELVAVVRGFRHYYSVSPARGARAASTHPGEPAPPPWTRLVKVVLSTRFLLVPGGGVPAEKLLLTRHPLTSTPVGEL